MATDFRRAPRVPYRRRKPERAGPRPGPGPGLTRRRTERSRATSGWLLDLQRRPGCLQTAEGHDGRDLPLLPHLVDLLLEVLEVLLGEVREAALLQEVLAHGLARPPLDDR